jgi:hypothetical protein
MHLPNRTDSRFRSKLDLDTAVQIRKLHAAGLSPVALARRYGIARSSLQDVVHRRSHVCVVPLRFHDTAYVTLRQLAAERGCTVNELVSMAVKCGVVALQQR